MKIDNGSLPPEADAFLQCRRVIIDQAALAVLGARAAWAALEHVTVMQQPVEHRTNCGNIAEQLAPVLHGTIGCQQRAKAFIAAHDDFQQILGGGVWEFAHAEVVDDE